MENNVRVAVIFGGESVEHKVSCRSAAYICKNLESMGHTVVPIGISRNGKWSIQVYDSRGTEDPSAVFQPSTEVVIRPGEGLFLAEGLESLDIDIVFPVTHGTGGEDGRLQSLLDLAHVPYVGCGSTASSNGMHKYLSKILAKEVGVPTLPAMVIDKRRVDLVQDSSDPYLAKLVLEISTRMGEQLIVKPEDGGSSVGVVVVDSLSTKSLLTALRGAARYSQSILIEPWLSNIEELEVAVITDGEAIEASDPGLMVDPKRKQQQITTYEQKYLAVECAYMQVPAPLSPEVATQVSQFAIDIAKAIGMEGYARVDFFHDPSDGSIYFNEINTLPGMTAKSHFPILAESIGYEWSRLLTTLIKEGLSSHNRKHACDTIAVE